jgi:predicted dehydrogenase
MRRELVSGGLLIDAGIHPLDTLLWWFGDPVSFFYEDDSLGGLESNVRLRLVFPDDTAVYFRQSRTCTLANEFNIVAERGTLVLSNYNAWQYRLLDGNVSRIHNCVESDLESGHWERCQLRDFAESILYGRPPRVTGDEGTRVIRLIEACYESKRSRPRPHKVPPPGLTW